MKLTTQEKSFIWDALNYYTECVPDFAEEDGYDFDKQGQLCEDIYEKFFRETA